MKEQRSTIHIIYNTVKNNYSLYYSTRLKGISDVFLSHAHANLIDHVVFDDCFLLKDVDGIIETTSSCGDSGRPLRVHVCMCCCM